MKAGAFGRPPERRQPQPGGRVLPGMFSSPSPSPAPSSMPSSRPASGTSAAPKLANPSGNLLSSWGTAGRGSGRLPGTAPSRLERLASEGVGAGASRLSDSGSDGPTRGGTNASISRARQLGLNRRARTPSPPSSPEYSPERSYSRSPSPPPARQRARAASQAAPSPFTRERDRQSSLSPPRNRPRRSSSPPPVAAIPPAGDTEQPQGILSSLWGRAAQLVGGTAAQQPTVVKEVGHNRANSVDSSLPAPDSRVTPFQLHDGAAGDEHDPHARDPAKEQSTLRNTRPIALPPLVAPARASTTSGTSVAARRVSAPALARAASEPLPPVEPITYHRPPPLHPRDALLAQQQRRRAAGGAPSSPYDWLEPRDEAPLEPFLFQRAVGRAPTRRGGRAARRPQMLHGAATEPTVAGVTALAGGGAAALAAGGAARAATVHPLQAAAMSSVPPLAPPAFAYAPPAHLAAPPVHPGAPPAHPGAPPAHPAVSAYQPAPPTSAYAPPLVAPAQPWGAAPAAAAAAALPLAVGGAAAFGEGAPAGGYEPSAPTHAPAPAAEEEPAAEPLLSYESRPAAGEGPADEAERQAHPYGAPAQQVHDELPRSGTGPDSLPIYPSPSLGAAAQPQVSSAPQMSMPPGSYAQSPYEQSGYPPSTSQPSYGAPTSQPYSAAASQSAAAPALVPPASLAPTSQPYYPVMQAVPQYATTAAPAAAPAPSAAAHQAAHFGDASPSLSTVAGRLLASAAAAAVAPRAPAAVHAPPSLSPPHSAAPSTSVSGAHGDLPPGPPILPITPPPVPPVPTSHAPPTSQSLYPAHLAAVQPQQAQVQGTLAQTSWGAPVPPLPPQPMPPVQDFARMPSPAAPSPAPPSPAPSATAGSPAPAHIEEEDDDAEPPAYTPPTSAFAARAPGTSEKEALSLPPHTAVQIPLPPSPAPPPLPTSPAPPPLPPTPASAASPPPPVPPKPPVLLVSTAASPPPAAEQSQFVLTPPTPIEPRSLAGAAPAPLVVADESRIEDAEEQLAPAPVPAPVLQPLELGFTLDDLGLGGLDFGLGLETPVEAAKEEPREPLPWPERASSPAVQFGEDEEDEEEYEDDPLDEAFDAATSFVTSFAEADLARARVDPGHSARTDRWLEQQGVQRQSVEALKPAEDPAPAEQPTAPGLLRPRTAPPASLAPTLLTPRAYTPSSLHTRTSSFSSPSASLPSPPPPPAAHARTASLSYTPQLAFLSTLRERSSAGGGSDDGDGPPSPLETSIGLPEAAMSRSRAVSVDELARAAQVEGARVASAGVGGVGKVPLAGGPSVAGLARSETAAADESAMHSESPGKETLAAATKEEKGKGRATEDADEPLTGDKGETASEVAAMFANW
ncbi:hypothetical protein JCM10449v2_001080 [Rhodotorula kratochvilovae]